jgi:ABC-type nitrate/sulfonate/bicarbonate transport system substrate-binding protein
MVGMAFRNENSKIICVINKSELENVVARKDHGIEKISDLKGKTVALPKGTISEFYLNRFLSLNGVNPLNVTVVNMTLSQSQAAIVNGSVDALANWQPYTNAVSNSLGGNAVEWSVQSNNLTNQTVVPDYLNYIYVDGLNSVEPELVNIIR